ncbi:unnamed protein product [Euphydryas editha]|uniref:Uncharacterized protein n=1 Tax=Euphydryas editha TaxID=104508 RepID=A0AAU9T9F8_EUPED|nr:unnamed protein product [Euphydryas editha]
MAFLDTEFEELRDRLRLIIRCPLFTAGGIRLKGVSPSPQPLLVRLQHGSLRYIIIDGTDGAFGLALS